MADCDVAQQLPQQSLWHPSPKSLLDGIGLLLGVPLAVPVQCRPRRNAQASTGCFDDSLREVQMKVSPTRATRAWTYRYVGIRRQDEAITPYSEQLRDGRSGQLEVQMCCPTRWTFTASGVGVFARDPTTSGSTVARKSLVEPCAVDPQSSHDERERR